MVRKVSFVFAVLFVLVVATGWMPHAITHMEMTPDGPERTMWGLFKMSMLDDVTHGLSALLLLVASLTSRRWSIVALTAFGWYYACDAAFFLINGVIGGKPVVQNLLLNLPHVIISGVMLGIVYWLAPREDERAGVGVSRLASSV